MIDANGRIATYYRDGKTWRLGVRFWPDGKAIDVDVERRLKAAWHRLAHEFGPRRSEST